MNSGLESAPMRTLAAGIALLALAVGAGMQAQDNRGADLVRSAVITGATLIDPTGTPIPNTVIVINGSRIGSVGRVPPEPGSTVGGPAGAEVIDARGEFVMPGLADMHNHLEDGGINFQQNRLANLGRLLAAGVTTVFDPNVPEGDFAKLKAAAAADHLSTLASSEPDQASPSRAIRSARRVRNRRRRTRRARWCRSSKR